MRIQFWAFAREKRHWGARWREMKFAPGGSRCPRSGVGSWRGRILDTGYWIQYPGLQPAALGAARLGIAALRTVTHITKKVA